MAAPELTKENHGQSNERTDIPGEHVDPNTPQAKSGTPHSSGYRFRDRAGIHYRLLVRLAGTVKQLRHGGAIRDPLHDRVAWLLVRVSLRELSGLRRLSDRGGSGDGQGFMARPEAALSGNRRGSRHDVHHGIGPVYLRCRLAGIFLVGSIPEDLSRHCDDDRGFLNFCKSVNRRLELPQVLIIMLVSHAIPRGCFF